MKSTTLPTTVIPQVDSQEAESTLHLPVALNGPILETLGSPENITRLSLEQLEQLADEVRQKLISTVSKTGGHIAPSLGTVDLTVALMSVFNVEHDKFVWDVGHQAYTYKILTDRADKFDTLRQLNGISGFPSRSESPYDHFGTGHASTSLSAALGLAAARDMSNENHHVISIIGDGSLTGGMVYEALNNAGATNRPFIVILNDNEMSIAKNVGALSLFMSRNLSKRWVRRIKREVEGFLHNVPGIGEDLVEIARRSKNSFKNFFTPGILFEALNFNYIGAVNGHDIGELQKHLQLAATQDRPVLVHVLTTKGYGYEPAVSNPVDFHGISTFSPETGNSITVSDGRPTYTKVFGKTLTRLAHEHDEVVAITAAMPGGTGLSSFAQEHPDQFFDVGICEQHAVTFAGGLATQGYKPFVAIYSTFLQRAYDQIVHDICLQNLPVTFCIDRAGVVGEDGATHQGAFDISFMRHVPNMTIFAPANEEELARGIITAYHHDGPFAIRYPRGKGCGVPLSDNPEPIPLAQGEYLLKSSDGLAIIALGHVVPSCLEAAQELADEGHRVSLFNARWVKPLPEKDIKEIFKTYDTIVIVEEHALAGGFSSAVMEFAIDNDLLHGQKLIRHGFPDEFIPHGEAEAIKELFHLNKNGIKEILLASLAN